MPAIHPLPHGAAVDHDGFTLATIRTWDATVEVAMDDAGQVRVSVHSPLEDGVGSRVMFEGNVYAALSAP